MRERYVIINGSLMIVNRGWQESTTTEEEMQAVNRNINEQKKQTIETLRQTIKEWDIS